MAAAAKRKYTDAYDKAEYKQTQTDPANVTGKANIIYIMKQD
jgi:hypothetical protein